MVDHIDAWQIAQNIHKGQIRWDGTPYENHVKIVGDNSYTTLKSLGYLPQAIVAKSVGYLHDTVEDHPDKISFDGLKLYGFSDEIVDAVKLLTRDKNLPYIDYLLPIKDNFYACVVKIEDLKHNISCFPLDKRKGSMYDKYLLALHILEAPGPATACC